MKEEREMVLIRLDEHVWPKIAVEYMREVCVCTFVHICVCVYACVSVFICRYVYNIGTFI